MEVPLRGPDCLEAVPIRELRSFEEQAIALLRILSLVAREIEKTEPHSLLLHGTASGAPISAGIVSEDDDCESATQGPEELQHGNIKRDARHGEPDTSLTSNAPVHTEEEVCNVPMGDHYSFWRARGTRCVNQVCQGIGGPNGRKVLSRFAAQIDLGCVQVEDGDILIRRILEQAALREQDMNSRIPEHERQPLTRVDGIERNVRAASLENAEQPHDHFQRPLDADSDENVGADTERSKTMGDPVGTSVQLGIGQRLPLERKGNLRRRSLDLRLEQLMYQPIGREINPCIIPVPQLLRDLIGRKKRQSRNGRRGVRDHFSEQCDHMSKEPLDGVRVVQLGIVFAFNDLACTIVDSNHEITSGQFG